MNLRGFVNFLLNFLECFPTSSDGVACYLYHKSALYWVLYTEFYIQQMPFYYNRENIVPSLQCVTILFLSREMGTEIINSIIWGGSSWRSRRDISHSKCRTCLSATPLWKTQEVQHEHVRLPREELCYVYIKKFSVPGTKGCSVWNEAFSSSRSQELLWNACVKRSVALCLFPAHTWKFFRACYDALLGLRKATEARQN